MLPEGDILQYLIETTHPQWHDILKVALAAMNPAYLDELQKNPGWLPGRDKLFAAFSLPIENMRYILLGESPYPRASSANGYAFWDNAVQDIWSAKGLSKEVNRATSLRNLVKTMLVAQGDLTDDLSQEAIAALDKTHYLQTAEQLFLSFIDHGFLLLNATLVYSPQEVRYHAKQWRPFVSSILMQLRTVKPSLTLLLFGRIAAEVPEACYFSCLTCEHPYNLSFIRNPDVLTFFKPLNLLSRHE